MRLLSASLIALAGLASISALLAQTVDGVDIQAVKKRSADLVAEAQAFVDQVEDRGDQFRDEAAAVRENGTENMRRISAKDLPKGPAGPVDFDEIVRGATINANARGVVVFCGFPNNSAKEFVARIGKVVEQGQLASIGIDPRLFHAFDVQAVPTYVTVIGLARWRATATRNGYRPPGWRPPSPGPHR